MKSEKKRLGWIDIAKSFGILIVLFNHSNLNLGELTFLGGMFYMPVFFVLAGYTFSFQQDQGWKTFVRKKAKRLIWPYLVFNFILYAFFLIKGILGGSGIGVDTFIPLLGIFYGRSYLFTSGGDPLYLMTILNGPTWFLPALFVSLLLYRLIAAAAGNDLKKMGLIALGSGAIAWLLELFSPVLLPWSLDTACFAVLLLLVGDWMKRVQLVEKLCRKPLWLVPVTAVFLICSYPNSSGNMSINKYGLFPGLYFLAGAAGSLLCIMISVFIERYLGKIAVVFGYIGKNTLCLLCLHMLMYALLDPVLQALGISGLYAVPDLLKITVSILLLVPLNRIVKF